MIEYRNTGIINYNALYVTDDEGEDVPLFYTEKTKRYLQIRYGSLHVDWTLSDSGDESFYKRQKYNYFDA